VASRRVAGLGWVGLQGCGIGSLSLVSRWVRVHTGFGCMVDGTCGLDTANSNSYFGWFGLNLVLSSGCCGSFVPASNPGLDLLSKIVLLLFV